MGKKNFRSNRNNPASQQTKKKNKKELEDSKKNVKSSEIGQFISLNNCNEIFLNNSQKICQKYFLCQKKKKNEIMVTEI